MAEDPQGTKKQTEKTAPRRAGASGGRRVEARRQRRADKDPTSAGSGLLHSKQGGPNQIATGHSASNQTGRARPTGRVREEVQSGGGRATDGGNAVVLDADGFVAGSALIVCGPRTKG